MGVYVNPKGIHEIEREICTLCGEYVKVCPYNVLRFTAREMEVKEIVQQVIEDKIYYDISRGRVILSGIGSLV